MEKDWKLLEKIRTIDGASFIFKPIGEVKKALQKYVEQGIFERIVVTQKPDSSTVYAAFIYQGEDTLPDIMYFNEKGGNYV